MIADHMHFPDIFENMRNNSYIFTIFIRISVNLGYQNHRIPLIARKVITGILLFILSFNWLGYDLVLSVIDSNLRTGARAAIERGDYNASTLREIRVDLGLPYPTDWSDFEQVNGTVTVDGIVYEFVERKYEQGQMVYRVLPNFKSTEVQKARAEVLAMSLDREQDDPSGTLPGQISLFKKLNIETTVNVLDGSPALMADIHQPMLRPSVAYPLDGHVNTSSRPPEA